MDMFRNGPISVIWNITSRCNLKCAHCMAEEFSPHWNGELSVNKAIRIVNNVKCGRPIAFTLSGGDPLSHPLIIDIVDVINHSLDDVSITSFTNGSINYERMAHLLRRGVRLIVSLEGGASSQHDELRGKGVFDRVVSNLKRLLETPYQDQVEVNYTLTAANADPDRLLHLCAEIGLRHLTISTLQSVGGARNTVHLMPTARQRYEFACELLVRGRTLPLSIFIAYLTPYVTQRINAKHGLALPLRYRGCRSVSSEIIVAPDGNVVPCKRMYPEMIDGKLLSISRFNLEYRSIQEYFELNECKIILRTKNPGVYPNYTPCSVCDFAGNYCDPCWIEQYRGEDGGNDICKYVRSIERDVITAAALEG